MRKTFKNYDLETHETLQNEILCDFLKCFKSSIFIFLFLIYFFLPPLAAAVVLIAGKRFYFIVKDLISLWVLFCFRSSSSMLGQLVATHRSGLLFLVHGRHARNVKRAALDDASARRLTYNALDFAHVRGPAEIKWLMCFLYGTVINTLSLHSYVTRNQASKLEHEVS